MSADRTGDFTPVDITDRLANWARSNKRFGLFQDDMAEAIGEIKRLRELIRRALADGMGVLDEPEYDLYGELSTYLAPNTKETNP